MDNALVRALRARGVNLITAAEIEMIQRSDEEHLTRAIGEGRVLYSFNVGDFQRLHKNYLLERKTHSGIILARQQHYSVGEQTRRLLNLISGKSMESMRNQLEFLSAWD